MRLNWKSCLVAVAALFALLSTALTADARTTASPQKTIASYCSSSGDVCYGIFNRSGKVYLRITTAARYFKRYILCVRLLPAGTDATHARRCGWYPVFRQVGSTWKRFATVGGGTAGFFRFTGTLPRGAVVRVRAGALIGAPLTIA